MIALIVLYAAALRLIAITEIYGPVSTPGWLRATQGSLAQSRSIRPSSLRWDARGLFPHRDGPPTMYRSDPYTYLAYAREMKNFYAAHRREPLFAFATRLSLTLLDDQDVAVSFASGVFSVLVVLATFGVGRHAFGYGVGAGAAALAAIEYDLISWGVEGWRDEAFTCGVLLTLLALLAYLRSPNWRWALVLGLAAAGACLVRITSLSFVLPVLVAALVWPGIPRQTRYRGAALAAAAASVLVAPFLLNCWRVYGDPLYSINVHASVYQEAEGQTGDPQMTASRYLGQHLRSRPVETIDTVIQGLSVYPFCNKWTGFSRWEPALVRWLPVLSVGGILAFAAFPNGRLLLLALAASLIPYAATWKLGADWRFTQHAYPFFLIASSLGCSVLIQGARILATRDVARLRRYRAGLAWVCGAGIAAAALWYASTRVLPAEVVKEQLRKGQQATLTALDRDWAFFGAGWRRGSLEDLPLRITNDWRAEIYVPLPARGSYDMLLRVDPSTHPVDAQQEVPRISLLLNSQLLARCTPGSAPDRIGTCRFRVPPDAIVPGMQRLTVAVNPQHRGGFRVWSLRITPRPDST